MPAIPSPLTRDQLMLALAQINPAYEYRFLDDGSYEFRGPGDVPSDAAILAAWAAVDAVNQAATASASADATERGQFAGLRNDMDAAQNALQTFIDRPNPATANLAALNLVWNAVNLLCRIQLVQIRMWRYVINHIDVLR
jgi:hypothetical protein